MSRIKKRLIIVVVALIALFGIYKGGLYFLQEKSCRDYAIAWLEIDDKNPLVGQEKTSGYNNIEKYQKMYNECMFLQGY